ncbi:unnamed protein product [Amoebophrya sp. A25]|nr:unnamed protein product [Amoebophrya sp. A25]|eukprot:GSA25T00021581001.1
MMRVEGLIYVRPERANVFGGRWGQALLRSLTAASLIIGPQPEASAHILGFFGGDLRFDSYTGRYGDDRSPARGAVVEPPGISSEALAVHTEHEKVAAVSESTALTVVRSSPDLPNLGGRGEVERAVGTQQRGKAARASAAATRLDGVDIPPGQQLHSHGTTRWSDGTAKRRLQTAGGELPTAYIPPETVDYSSASQFRDVTRLTTCEEGEELQCLYRGGPKQFATRVVRNADSAGLIEVRWLFNERLCDDAARVLWCRIDIKSCDKQIGFRYYQCTDFMPSSATETTTIDPKTEALLGIQPSLSSPSWNQAPTDDDEWSNSELIGTLVGLVSLSLSIFAIWLFYRRYRHFGNFAKNPPDAEEPAAGFMFNDPRNNIDVDKNRTWLRNFFSDRAAKEWNIIDHAAVKAHREKSNEEEELGPVEGKYLLYCLSFWCCCLMKYKDRKKRTGPSGTVEDTEAEFIAKLEIERRQRYLAEKAAQEERVRRERERRRAIASEDRADAFGMESNSSWNGIRSASRRWMHELYARSNAKWFYKTRDWSKAARPYRMDPLKNRRQLRGKVARFIPKKPNLGAVRVVKGMFGPSSKGQRGVSPRLREEPDEEPDYLSNEDASPYYSRVDMHSPGGRSSFSPSGARAGASIRSPGQSPTAQRVAESDWVVEAMMGDHEEDGKRRNYYSFERADMDKLDAKARGRMKDRKEHAKGFSKHGIDVGFHRQQVLRSAVGGDAEADWAGEHDRMQDTFVSSDLSFDSRGGWRTPPKEDGVDSPKSGTFNKRNSYRVEKIRRQLEDRQMRKAEKRLAYESEVERQRYMDEEIQQNRINDNRERRDMAAQQAKGSYMEQTFGGSFRRRPATTVSRLNANEAGPNPFLPSLLESEDPPLSPAEQSRGHRGSRRASKGSSIASPKGSPPQLDMRANEMSPASSASPARNLKAISLVAGDSPVNGGKVLAQVYGEAGRDFDYGIAESRADSKRSLPRIPMIPRLSTSDDEYVGLARERDRIVEDPQRVIAQALRASGVPRGERHIVEQEVLDVDPRTGKLVLSPGGAYPEVNRGGRALWEIPRLAASVPAKKMEVGSAIRDVMAAGATLAGVPIPGLNADISRGRKPKGRLKRSDEDEDFAYEPENYESARNLQLVQETLAQLEERKARRQKRSGSKNVPVGVKDYQESRGGRMARVYQHVFRSANAFNQRDTRPDTSPGVERRMAARSLLRHQEETMGRAARREGSMSPTQIAEQEALKRQASRYYGAQSLKIPFSPQYGMNDTGSSADYAEERIARRWNRLRDEVQRHLGKQAARGDAGRGRLKQVAHLERDFGNDAKQRPVRGFLHEKQVPELEEYVVADESMFSPVSENNLTLAAAPSRSRRPKLATDLNYDVLSPRVEEHHHIYY